MIMPDIDYNSLEEKYNLPSGLLHSVAMQESGGDPTAISPSGAQGLFQFMPSTAKEYGVDPFNPNESAEGAARMYSDLLNKYNRDLPMALAAYNWGQGNVDRHGLENAPKETKNYISSISKRMNSGYPQYASSGQSMNDALPEGFVLEKDYNKQQNDALPEGFVLEKDYQPSATDTLSDIAKSGASSLTRSAISTPMLGTDILNAATRGVAVLGAKAYEGIGGHLTEQQKQNLSNVQPFYSSQDVQNAIAPVIKEKTGADIMYKPQTKAGEYASSVVGALPSAALPGVSLASAAGMGVGSQAGKDVAKSAGYGDIGQAVGSFVGGGLGAGLPSLGRRIANTEIMQNEASGSSFGSQTKKTLDDVENARDALSSNTNAAYKKAEDIGFQLDPKVSEKAGKFFEKTVNDEVNNGYPLDNQIHPQTKAAVNNFIKKSNSPYGLSLETIENTRKQLGKIAYDSNAGANDIGAAKKAIKVVDDIYNQIKNNPHYLQSGDVSAIDELAAGRAAHQLEMEHGEFAQIYREANGNPDKIQSAFDKIFNDRDKFNSYSDTDREIIKSIARPGKLIRNLQTIGKAGPGQSNPVNLAETAAILSMNPIAQGMAVAGSLAGMTANSIRRNIINKGLDTLLSNIESRSIPANMAYQSVNTAASGPTISALPKPKYGGSISNKLPKRADGGAVSEPTAAQKQVGNYKKDHMRWHGLDISIENKKGSLRSGVDSEGKKWRVKMPVDYGYFRRSRSGDGEHADVYVGPRLDSEKVFIINQKHLHNGSFDEHKVFIGFPQKGHALAAYRKAFSDGMADDRIMSIKECSIDELKNWLESTRV